MGELFITDNNQFSYRAETFRQIRALILSRRKKIKIIKSKAKYVTIGICSANPAEGKTTTAINLAISFANMGLKAILIETDVRRPTLSENLLQISYINEQSRNLNGFASFVENGKYEIQTTINKNFFIIQSGTVREKSIENITAKKIELILKQLSRKFDVIIFDTSPLLSVSDTLPILPFCDEVIHVVKAKSSRTSEFKRALKLYKQHGANMTGVVLNMTPRHDLSGEYGYGYGYGYGYARTYGYSYANADDKTKVSSNWNFNKNRNLNKKKRSRKIEYQESEQVTLMLDRIKKDLKLNERN
jgi:Mrp family chromosome partitioning ATPase